MEYGSGGKAKCPHCNVHVQFTSVVGNRTTLELRTLDDHVNLTFAACPACNRLVVGMINHNSSADSGCLLWPRSTGRPPVPIEVPAHITQDYNEAAAVLALSTKASAALSRRCMQAVLREAGGAQAEKLNEQIKQVESGLPTYLQGSLDQLREFGNFAAHPTRSAATGEIIEVEPGEAEWMLDVLDELFDYYFVKPKRAQDKRASLNQSLVAANRKPLA